jgi:hypothetical protein
MFKREILGGKCFGENALWEGEEILAGKILAGKNFGRKNFGGKNFVGKIIIHVLIHLGFGILFLKLTILQFRRNLQFYGLIIAFARWWSSDVKALNGEL